MKRLDAHSKLLSLLCFLLLACTSLVMLAGCGGLLPDQKAASPFESYDQVMEAFDQIVPGMTHAEDLPNMGFDTRTGNVDVLSYLNVEERFMPAAREHLSPAVQACIRAEAYCTGYVFHPSRSDGWSADVILLVMNGRVVHKVFSGNPHTQYLEDRRQPLRPLQDLGGAVARAAGSATSY
jgi:hypothetical protein